MRGGPASARLLQVWMNNSSGERAAGQGASEQRHQRHQRLQRLQRVQRHQTPQRPPPARKVF
jgi:hypothetical protein